MQKLYETFASKNPPDNTINRIAALEKLHKELGQRLDSNDDLLNKRLVLLEDKVNKNHESRIAALEADLKALKDSLSGNNMKSDEKMDVSQILVRINLLSVEINKKIDSSECTLKINQCNASLTNLID